MNVDEIMNAKDFQRYLINSNRQQGEGQGEQLCSRRSSTTPSSHAVFRPQSLAARSTAATATTEATTTTTDQLGHLDKSKEKVEYKRLRNRLAARNSRKRKQIQQDELQKQLDDTTKAYTKLIVEKYQIQTRVNELEVQNEELKTTANRLQQELEKAQDTKPQADKKTDRIWM